MIKICHPFANATVVEEANRITLQSYDSIVAIIDKTNKTIFLGRDWTYSNTTARHIIHFFDKYLHICASREILQYALDNETRLHSSTSPHTQYQVIYNENIQ